MPRKGKVRISLGLLILAVSILFLVWGYWPADRELVVRPVPGIAGSAPEAQRAITILFPPKIRVGEAGVVRLTLDVDALKNLLPAGAGIGDSEFYNTHNVIAEARLDLPGIPVQPTELISAPVSQGQTAVFYWTLRPTDTGNFRGTLWQYLRTVDKSTGVESRTTVSAQIIEIESVKFMGLVVNRARMIGLVAFGIGFFLSLPIFETLTGRLSRKRREIL